MMYVFCSLHTDAVVPASDTVISDTSIVHATYLLTNTTTDTCGVPAKPGVILDWVTLGGA